MTYIKYIFILDISYCIICIIFKHPKSFSLTNFQISTIRFNHFEKRKSCDHKLMNPKQIRITFKRLNITTRFLEFSQIFSRLFIWSQLYTFDARLQTDLTVGRPKVGSLLAYIPFAIVNDNI